MTDYKTLYVILTANASVYDSVLTRSGVKTDRFGQQLDNASDSSRRFSTELNSMSGRVRLIIDSLALVGPAAVNLGAMAIPAITGLSAQLGFAAAGGGAVIAAVMGMGDAIKALNDYQLEPTAANLEKVRQEMGQLSETSRAFVMELDQSIPMLESIQDAAREGFFPGATEGLDSALERLPKIRHLMYELGDAAGDLAADTGDALSSDRVAEFMDFLRRNARPSMEQTLETVGHLTGGLAEMWMAFDPINDDFSDWLLDQSKAFDRWSQGLEGSEGLEEFFDFLRESGPEVRDALVATADAGLQLLEALAPISGVSLKGIELVAEAVATIADSPIGTPLLAGFAAATLLNRSLMVTASLMTRLGMGGAAGGVQATRAGVGGAFMASLNSGSAKAQASVRALTADLRTMAAVSATAGARTQRDQARYQAALNRTRETVGRTTRAIAGGGAAVGAMALLTTGVADKAGIANTATLGLVGAMAGPYGAALGATIGLIADVAGANNDWEESMRGVDAGLGSSSQSLQAWLDKVGEVRSAADEEWAFQEQNVWKSLATNPSGTISTSIGGFRGLLGGDTNAQEMEKAADKAEETSARVLRAFGNTAVELGRENVFSSGIQNTWAPPIEKVAALIQRAEPYMARMGVTLDDLADMDDAGLTDFSHQLAVLITRGDSVRGRMGDVGDAVHALQDDTLAAADSAAQLSQALETLLSPALNAEQAYDKWRQSIVALRQELKVKGGFDAGSEQGLANRNLTRQYVADSVQRLTTLAGLTDTTEKQMADAVARTREEFIKSGIAAGFDRDQMVKRAKALGLTPKLVKTVFEAAGVTKADLQARQLRASYDTLPDKVQTLVRTEGVPTTNAEIDRLVKKYHLTEKQRTALVTIKDLASAGIIDVQQLLNRVDRTRAQARLEAEAASARAAIQDIIDRLNNLDGKTATTYVQVRQQSFASKQAGILAGGQANGGEWRGGVLQYADGGFGGNGRYYPREPMMVRGGANILWGEPETGWEAYISGKPGREGRNIGILRAAAGRFGYGLTQRGAVTPGGQTVTVIQQQFPSKVKLVVGGREFNAHIAGIAGGVAKGAVGSAQERSTTAGRRDWP